jgi:hypothetical protein
MLAKAAGRCGMGVCWLPLPLTRSGSLHLTCRLAGSCRCSRRWARSLELTKPSRLNLLHLPPCRKLTLLKALGPLAVCIISIALMNIFKWETAQHSARLFRVIGQRLHDAQLWPAACT